MKQSVFGIIQWFLSYKQKSIRNAKGPTRNARISKPIFFGLKLNTAILKPLTTLFSNFKFISFELTEKCLDKERFSRVGPGWAGSSHILIK